MTFSVSCGWWIACSLVFVADPGVYSDILPLPEGQRAVDGRTVGTSWEGGISGREGRGPSGRGDELYLRISPILLGDGVRLFEHLGDQAIRLRKIASLEAGDVSHQRFEILQH